MILVYGTNNWGRPSCIGREILDEDIKNPDRVTKLIADGPQLKRIHNWGYPNHGEDTQWFYGDFARQICANWT